MTQIEHQRISANGANFHVARMGRGRPIVLLHGWPEYWITWQPVMERLADRFELIAPDLRGFGDSDKPMGPFGPRAHADDLEALVAALGVGPVGIVAHDIGASIAQEVARSSPGLLAGLFMFNFVYPGIGDRFDKPAHLQYVWHTYFNRSELAPRLLRASPDGVRMFVTHFIELWAHRPEAIDAATLDALVANMEKAGNLEGGFDYYKGAAAQRAAEADDPQAAPIEIPTCVRWTEDDKALDIAWTDRLGEFFTDLDFVPFPDAGHFPHHEQPDRAAREIAAFFGRLASSRWPSC